MENNNFIVCVMDGERTRISYGPYSQTEAERVNQMLRGGDWGNLPPTDIKTVQLEYI